MTASYNTTYIVIYLNEYNVLDLEQHRHISNENDKQKIEK